MEEGLHKQNSKDNLILKKANINQEELILNMIKLSEIRITKLLLEFKMYKDPNNPNYDFIRRLRMRYTKKRNIQKANLARIEREKKNLKLIQEIEEKNDHPLFLQKIRKDLQNQFGRVNSLIPRKKRVKIGIPGIEDFLFAIISSLIMEKNAFKAVLAFFWENPVEFAIILTNSLFPILFFFVISQVTCLVCRVTNYPSSLF